MNFPSLTLRNITKFDLLIEKYVFLSNLLLNLKFGHSLLTQIYEDYHGFCNEVTYSEISRIPQPVSNLQSSVILGMPNKDLYLT